MTKWKKRFLYFSIIIFVILFGYFIWPTPWRTYPIRDSGTVVGVTKINRFTNAICIFQYDWEEKVGDCWRKPKKKCPCGRFGKYSLMESEACCK